jgi:ABC-type nitrate/sulfonate/bicarbonate transport system substrate-binding protein
MISESNGADGVVAKSDAVLTLSDLNREGAKFVVAGHSRSDLLSRVARDQIDLSGMGASWQLVKKTGLGVLEQMQMDSAEGMRAYVLWEPQLSVVMQDTGTHLLADATSLSVPLVDVLVVSNAFLDQAPTVVEAVVQAYAEAFRVYLDETKLLQLIGKDAHEAGGDRVLDKDALHRIRTSLSWMSLEDNYNAFQGTDSAPKVQGIRNRLDVIMDLLLETDAVPRDPFGDDPSRLIYDQIVKTVYEKRVD